MEELTNNNDKRFVPRDTKKSMVILFFILLLIPNLLGKFLSKETINLENRTLAQFPKISKDNWEEFPGQVEDYINDHAPFRYEILDAYAEFNWNVFGAVDNRDVIKGKEGWLFYRGNGSMTDVLGLNIFSEEGMQMLLDKLLRLREVSVENPEQFVFFIAPNKERVYHQYMPDYYKPISDNATASVFVDYIRSHSDIKVVYPLEELKRISREEQIYYKTDTHWNRPGGFVGVQSLIEALEGESTAFMSVNTVWETGIYRGDQANQIHIPDAYVEDHYGDIKNYLDGPEPKIEQSESIFKSCRESAFDERRMVMVRDSFGENMLPWLSKYFQETEIVHYSYIPQMDKDSLDGDVFVYEIVERYLGALSGRLDEVLSILDDADTVNDK